MSASVLPTFKSELADVLPLELQDNLPVLRLNQLVQAVLFVLKGRYGIGFVPIRYCREKEKIFRARKKTLIIM